MENQSHFSLLYSSVSPHVFGCVAFDHVPSVGQDKLSPRSIKCIFLGYSRTQKGYRCYCPPARQYFVGANVTFSESTPFFHPQVTAMIPILCLVVRGGI